MRSCSDGQAYTRVRTRYLRARHARRAMIGHSAEEGRSKVTENSGGKGGMRGSTHLLRAGSSASSSHSVLRASHTRRGAQAFSASRPKNGEIITPETTGRAGARRPTPPLHPFAGRRACPQAHDRTCESTPRETNTFCEPARGTNENVRPRNVAQGGTSEPPSMPDFSFSSTKFCPPAAAALLSPPSSHPSPEKS
jgi:hypothetical protein